jgi:hypothetical protein
VVHQFPQRICTPCREIITAIGFVTVSQLAGEVKIFPGQHARWLFDAGWDTATIDTIVCKAGDQYYAIIKDERYPLIEWPTGKTIRICTAPALLDPYSEPGPSLSPNFREAPTLIPSPNGKAWYLYYEQYPGVAYGLSVATHLNGPWFQPVGYQKPDWDKYSLPPKVRHGSMLLISGTDGGRKDCATLVKATRPAAAKRKRFFI